MPKSARPRRSVLYMPGPTSGPWRRPGRPRRWPDPRSRGRCRPRRQGVARRQVCEAVKGGGYGMRELIVRVNGLATPWGYADIVQASRSGADAILLPKVESADAVRHWSDLLANGAPDHMAIWAMMETPRSVRSEQIAVDGAHAVPRHGHVGPGEGARLWPYARTAAVHHFARAVPARRPGVRVGDPRRRLSRSQRRPGFELPAGRAARWVSTARRRSIRIDRRVHRGFHSDAAKMWTGRARSSPHTRPPRRGARGSGRRRQVD